MNQSIQDAIETVDNAREHKCELEGRRNQLNIAIAQVRSTAERTKKEIKSHYMEMQRKLTAEIQARSKSLIEAVNAIEKESLEPLIECKEVVEDGITESISVVNTGDSVLNSDMESENGLDEVKKFIGMADGLELGSLPEVPSITEVASISVMFDDDFIPTLIKAIKLEGTLNRQSPVQITGLEPRPGGIVVSWDEIEDGSNNKESPVLYKLQMCLGRVTVLMVNGKLSKESSQFRDIYTGLNYSFFARNLQPNSMYTFRVCRCQLVENSDTPKQWSPWSVSQEKLTTMPGLTWSPCKANDAYTLTERKKIALKKNNHGKVLYTDVSACMISYPMTFKVDLEGKSRHKSDCIALCIKRDPDSTTVHTKEGTLCIMADGRVWLNGNTTQTRFNPFCRGMMISFKVDDAKELSEKKPAVVKGCDVFRVTISVDDREAVFDWTPSKSSSVINSQTLAYAILFQSSGWRVSIL